MRADALESLLDAMRSGKEFDVFGDDGSSFALRWLSDESMMKR
jgi:hypothetical protein